MISTFPFQWRPNTPVTQKNGVLTQFGQYLLLALYNRSGAGAGIQDVVTTNISAAGLGQAGATALLADINSIDQGAGGVLLYSLQPGQRQQVYNGLLAAINVYPAVGGQIDQLGINNPFVLNPAKTQIFTCFLLSPSKQVYRSLQLG